MDQQLHNTSESPCWFVGAMYGGSEDQTKRFLEEGIWENGYKDKYLDIVNSIKKGDRIAIKAAYTRKKDLPFDNRGHTVSVMSIKATGVVKENIGDGRHLKVDWKPLEAAREWYFYTNRVTIWSVLPGEWENDALINFAYENIPQDIDRFRNEPYWRERYGDKLPEDQRFLWTQFYQAIADRILDFKEKREELLHAIYSIADQGGGLSHLHEEYANGKSGPLKDICPFTVMGIFNRGLGDENRIRIASELARFLSVSEPVPTTFDGIPILNNMSSLFFSFEVDREPGTIDTLWEVFEKAIIYADQNDLESRSNFLSAYDKAASLARVGWNLTMGLYWIRPWTYLTLDTRSREYIRDRLGISLGLNGPKNRCNSNDYLSAVDTLETRFRESAYTVHSFPELSLAAWSFTTEAQVDELDIQVADETEDVLTVAPIIPYLISDIIEDGSFISSDRLKEFIERLRTKKNLILQGPPGTGKTWLAKRLAFALMGQRDESRLKAVQFHPNLSYEDFIRGWRPSGEGKLTLVDGPFLEIVNAAAKKPTIKYVIVIEEINRGNPAQIFGEMLTLLEVDKRTPTEALELSYCREKGERVFIPDNLYVIGTMNVADRSLALVDMALRRRFAFINLKPEFGKPWRDWVHSQSGIETGLISEIEGRILSLNEEIQKDTSLGKQFLVGHSFVTPPLGGQINDAREWFKQVVETEIGPLLEEYWFDSLDLAEKAKEKLLQGL